MPTPNPVKTDSTYTEQLGCIRKDYLLFGVQNKEYGPTDPTNFWSGVTPPSVTSYVVYTYRETNGPIISVAHNDAEMIILGQDITTNTFATAADAIAFLSGDSNYAVMNITDYPNVVTEDLITLADAGSTLSYPRKGDLVWDLSQISVQSFYLTNVGFSATAATGGAWVFDGTEAYGEPPMIVSSSNFTVDVWFKAESVGGAYTTYTPFGYAGPLDNNNYLLLNTDGSAILANFALGEPDITSTGGFTLGEWTNIVFTHDNTTEESKFYINGVLDSTHSTPGWGLGITHYIGTNAPGTDTNYFKGNISVVKTYQKALSSTEVTQNFNAYKVRYI